MPQAVMPLLCQLAAFVLAVLPLLYENLRSGRAANRHNVLLFSIGLGFAMLASELGWTGRSAATIMSWVLGAGLLLIAAAALRWVPGGIAKTLGALVPWFPFGAWLVVVTLGFALAAVAARIGRGRSLIVPPLALAAVGVILVRLALALR